VAHLLNLTRRIGSATRWMALAFFLWGVGEGLWIYIQPLYPTHLGATPEQTGLALSMLGIGRVVSIVPFTVALHYFNPRTVYIPGFLAGVVGAFLLTVAPTWQLTTIGFFFYGVSSAALIPVHLYLVQAAHQSELRQGGVSLHTLLTYTWAANAAGIILSPAIGGYLGESAGLRVVFGLSGVWFALSTLAAMACPTFAYQPPSSQHIEPGRLLRNYRYLRLNALFLLVFMVGPLGYVLLPTYLQEGHHYSTEMLGMLGMLSAVGITIWSLYLGNREPKRGYVVGQALIFFAFGAVLLSQRVPLVALSYFLYGAWSALRPLAVSLIANVVRFEQQSFAFAAIDFLQAFSGILAPILAGALYARYATLPLLAAFLLSGAALVVTFAVVHQHNLRLTYTYIRDRIVETAG